MNGGGVAAAAEFSDDDLVQVLVLARRLPSLLVFKFVSCSLEVYGAVRSLLTMIFGIRLSKH